MNANRIRGKVQIDLSQFGEKTEIVVRALKCLQEAKYDECRTLIDEIIELNPDNEQILCLWKEVDNIRKQKGLPYIFPAGLGEAQSIDGISGFLSAGDLEVLRYCSSNSYGKCVNIGVFNGLSTYVIAKNNPDMEVYGIDAYRGMSAQLNEINYEQAQSAKQNLSRLANAHLIVGFSSDIAQEWADEISFLFIDGDHSVDGAVSDFQTWSYFVNSNGLIAVHDTYGKVNQSILKVRQKDNSHGPDVICQMMSDDPNYEFVTVNGCTEVWRKKAKVTTTNFACKNHKNSRIFYKYNLKHKKIRTSRIAKYCPETCIVFTSYERPEIAARSYDSLTSAISPYRDRVSIIISDATDDEQKMSWARNTDADDVILTPRFTPAATSRNMAMTLILDKYSPRFLGMVEDDFEYHADWYSNLIEAMNRLYGVISPFDLAYGIFSACDHHIPPERRKEDKLNGVTAYIFGAVAYQRFMPTSHYLAVMRGWDADLLGISYAQTGGQTFRNTMRGFCGAILPGKLSWPIDTNSTASTWSKGKRDPGPPAHSFDLSNYDVIREAVRKVGVYQRNEK
ncbi:MAG: class I SAM-dependent methyltransferase [Dissulfuribacterales bacterium]